MKLKVFRLKEGKLEFIGLREPKAGDAIVEGATPMTEVRPGVLAPLDLREASTSDFPLMFKTTPPTEAELDAAKKLFNDKKLDASIRKAHPEYTDKQIDIFKRGR